MSRTKHETNELPAVWLVPDELWTEIQPLPAERDLYSAENVYAC